MLLIPGSSFNLESRTHLRMTLLPPAEVLGQVFDRVERVLARRLAASAAPSRRSA